MPNILYRKIDKYIYIHIICSSYIYIYIYYAIFMKPGIQSEILKLIKKQENVTQSQAIF